jgi:uncharacterized phage-associated protein
VTGQRDMGENKAKEGVSPKSHKRLKDKLHRAMRSTMLARKPKAVKTSPLTTGYGEDRKVTALPVRLVAKFIIQESDFISNLKLQKLLYYVQGWYLGLKGIPLFPEEIQAWVHGPVVPSVFQEYRSFGWTLIEKPLERIELPMPQANHIRSVLHAYGKYGADDLRRFTHVESPWVDARKGLADNDRSNREITHQSMREFFARKARKQA